MSEEHYQEGRFAADHYYNAQGFSSYTRQVRAKDAIKLFKPPVNESRMQIVVPLPEEREDWIRGFRERQTEILKEVSNVKK